MALVTYRIVDGVMVEPRVGIGGAEEHPRRIPEAEAALAGEPAADKAFRAAGEAAAAAIDPLEDVQADAAFRRDSRAHRDAPRTGARRRMNDVAHGAETKGSGLTWVGRSIRRVEDPALVAGNGRFTGDLAATHHVRFVRSSFAAGRIKNITAPDGVRMFTAADLAGVKPIKPMLHKFDYVPVAQPILAEGVVRFVGEPIAAVIAATEAEAEDGADLVEVEIDETAPAVDARDAVAPGAPAVHAKRPAT